MATVRVSPKQTTTAHLHPPACGVDVVAAALGGPVKLGLRVSQCSPGTGIIYNRYCTEMTHEQTS